MSRQFWSETLAWVTADGTAITNTTTETVIYPAVTIPANYFQDGRLLRVICRGKYGNVNTTPGNIRFRVRLGGISGTVVADTGNLALAASTVTNDMFVVEATLQVRANGSSGTVMALGTATIGTLSTNKVAMMGSAGATAPATATVDFTANKDLVVSAEFTTANASNTLTGLSLVVEALN